MVEAMRQNAPMWFVWFVALVVLIGGSILGYFWFFQRVSPLQSHRLVGIEADGSGAAAHLYVTREVCMARETDAEAFRIFRRLPSTAGGLEEVYETLPTRIHLNAGCTMRARRVDLPDGLAMGRYVYQTGFRFCNVVGRCETEWLPPATITVDGHPGRHVITIE